MKELREERRLKLTRFRLPLRRENARGQRELENRNNGVNVIKRGRGDVKCARAIFTLKAGRRSESCQFESHLGKSGWEGEDEKGGSEGEMKGTDGEEAGGQRQEEEEEERRGGEGGEDGEPLYY